MVVTYAVRLLETNNGAGRRVCVGEEEPTKTYLSRLRGTFSCYIVREPCASLCDIEQLATTVKVIAHDMISCLSVKFRPSQCIFIHEMLHLARFAIAEMTVQWHCLRIRK